MYPINAASPERIAVGAVVQISDGSVQTAGVTVSVTKQGGSETGSAGTIAFSTGGICFYTPTQGETNATSFIVTAYKTGCIPVAVTIVTTASGTPGYAGVDWGKVTNASSTVNLSATTINLVNTVTTVTNQLTAAAIATGLWQDATAGDFTVANSIGKSIMNGVSLGTGLTVNDITTKTGFALTAAYDAAKTAAQAGDAMTLTSAYDFAKGTVAITEAYRANGAAPTPAQFISEVLAHLGEAAISGTTKTIKKLDHSTTAETFTLDSATDPASITRAT